MLKDTEGEDRMGKDVASASTEQTANDIDRSADISTTWDQVRERG